MDFPCSSAGKESSCNDRDLGSIPGLGRSPGEGKGYSLQYSDLENAMDCLVHGVEKSRTRLNDFHFTSLHFLYNVSSICDHSYVLGLPSSFISGTSTWSLHFLYTVIESSF